MIHGQATSRNPLHTPCRTLSDHPRRCRVFSHESLPQHNFSAPQNYPAHGKVAYLHKTCAECLTSFPTNSNLEQHASSFGHTAFSCACGAQFSRAYTLTRHINSMIGPSFACELCDDKVFPRLDKLCDHLRRWHRLGARAFDQYKGGSSSPGSASPPAGGGNSPLQGGALGQGYPVATGFGPMSMLDDFSTHAAPDASSVGSSASPGSSTVS